MVREKNAKITGLALSAIILIISLFDVPADSIGLSISSPWHNRITFNFFHASFIHGFMNVWCLLALLFYYDLPLRSIIAGFLISATFPIAWCYQYLPMTEALTIPTIGLSGVCFYLIGRASFIVQRKIYFQCWVWTSLIIGFVFAKYMNGHIHLYCYAIGVIVSYFNKPIK